LLHLCLLLGLLSQPAFADLPKIEGNHLVDDYLHLSVDKPAAWHFLTPKEKRDRRTANRYKNKTWGMWVRQETFPDRIVIAKYPEPHRGLNPTITVDRYPLGELRFKTGLWIAGADLHGLKGVIFTPLVVSDGPRPADLSGKTAGYYRASFDLDLVDGPRLSLRRQVWAVSTALSVIYVTAMDAQSGPDFCAAEIDAVIASLKLDL
jgi:hypothetical protein